MRLKNQKSKPTAGSGGNHKRKKNPRAFKKYLAHAKVASLAMVCLAAIGVFGFSGYPKEIGEIVSKKFYAQSAKMGFKLDEIIVRGRDKIDRDLLLKTMRLNRGDPILAIDLNRARARVEKIEWVRDAVVIRRLPNLLYLKITEREPIALWQNDKKIYLVDKDGTPIRVRDGKTRNLPLVVGEGAPAKTPELLKALKEFPKISENARALCRVRGRRWNLFLNGGTLVKLADANLKEGLQIVEKLLEERRIDLAIKEIDLRYNDRFFARTTPEVVEKIKNNRKGKKT